jgi:hypothetical protein
MAKDKTSFVLYSDSKSIIDLMTNEQAGLLLKTLFAYVNDENPIIDNSIALVFEMIKLQLKRDLKKWEQTKEGRSIAGKASAEAKRLAKLNQQNSTNSTNVDFVQQNSTNSTVSDSVSDSVSVSVSVSDSVNVNENLLKGLNQNFYDELLISEMWIEMVCKNNIPKFNKNQITTKLLEFKNDLEMRFDKKINKADFASHFVRWLNLQKNNSVKPFFDSPA